MLKRTALVFAAAWILVFAAPHPFFAQSPSSCAVGQLCSVSIDLSNCLGAQVDFNVPGGGFHSYWTSDNGVSVNPWDGACNDTGCDETDYFNGDFDGQGIAVVSYTIEWTNQGGQTALFYDGFCTDTSRVDNLDARSEAVDLHPRASAR